MNCWKCGAEIQEGRDRCVVCYASAYKFGFLSRWLNWLKGMGAAMPRVSFSIQTSTTDPQQTPLKNPVEIALSKETFSVQKKQVLFGEQPFSDQTFTVKTSSGPEQTYLIARSFSPCPNGFGFTFGLTALCLAKWPIAPGKPCAGSIRPHWGETMSCQA